MPNSGEVRIDLSKVQRRPECFDPKCLDSSPPPVCYGAHCPGTPSKCQYPSGSIAAYPTISTMATTEVSPISCASTAAPMAMQEALRAVFYSSEGRSIASEYHIRQAIVP